MGRIRRIAITLALCVLAVTAGLAAGCGGDSGPKIDSVTPNNGEPGSTVTLAGEVFGETQGESTVGFGTVTATVEKWSDGSIAITVPDGLEPGDYEISVTTEEGTSDAVSFTLTEPPAPSPSPTHTSTPTPSPTPTPTSTQSPEPPKDVTVPDVSGMTQEKAGRAISDAGLMWDVDLHYSDTVASGTVVGQAPAAGSKVPGEWLIDSQYVVLIFASKGPAPPGVVDVPVPAVLGQSATDAQATLMGVGFRVEILYLPGEGQGVVIQQFPAPKEKLAKGSKVAIVVSKKR